MEEVQIVEVDIDNDCKETVVTKGVMEGKIKNMDADILYTILIGPIHELAKHALRNNFKATFEEKEELFNCLINSIKI